MCRFVKSVPSLALVAIALFFLISLSGCTGLVSGTQGGTPGEITVTTTGSGTGSVTSSPSGINCSAMGSGTSSGTCIATFNGTVTLTAAPGTGFSFTGWSGCTSSSATTCTVSGAATVNASFVATLQSINHIIFLAQENRSFDEYFGAMRQYWAENGIADQDFDGLPQFNPPANSGLASTNPGCDPAFPYIAPDTNLYCQIDPASPAVQSFHMQSMCVENPSPSWAESHRDWNVHDWLSTTATMDGFVDAAANDGRQHTTNTVPSVHAAYFDTDGIRAMGYYDGGDLNYYYALASAFSTSDRWFSPVMTRTPPNREYLIAGTSHGYAYPRGTNPSGLNNALIPSTTIFEVLQKAGISWKIYVNPIGPNHTCADTDVLCLLARSYIHDFAFANSIRSNPSAYANNIVSTNQFAIDLANNTLPQIAQIEPASEAALDEHPSDDDPIPGQAPCCSIQPGAKYVQGLIGNLMGSASWADSVFILTWDEFGGFYDHVPPQPSVNPDGVHPVDLLPNDPCYQNPSAGPTCDFNYTGYRVPLVVISPYAKKNFVSHQVRDYTAILKLIETRFNLSPLTQRDAAQVGMDDPNTGFFDFDNAPWRTPPNNLPPQNTTGACYVDHLP